MRAALIACVLVTLVAAEVAAQDESCRQFSWSMGRKIDLFDEPLPVIETSQSLPKEGVFALLLKPAAEVIYPVAPDRGSDSGKGGVVTIESLPAGRYQIALSEEAWVDAIQNNVRLPALAPGRTRECPGVRRSLYVELKGEPVTIEIGGASVARLNIAVVRVWPFEWRW